MTNHSKIRLNRSDNEPNGFTLMELIVTVAIVSILVAIAVPSFQDLVRKNRIDSEAERIFLTFIRARNNALTTNSPSFVCRSTEGQTDLNSGVSCLINGMDELDWAMDLMVYTTLTGLTVSDPNNRFQNQRIQRIAIGAANDPVRLQMLQNISEAPNENLMVTSNTNDYVLRFNADGTVVNDTPFRIGICDASETYGKLIEINASGQIKLLSFDPDNTSRDCTPDAAI